MIIRRAEEADLCEIGEIHLSAFGRVEGPEIAELVNDLLVDATAEPLLSLLAELEGKLVGHVLFTAATLQPDCEPTVQILAPLAVLPGFEAPHLILPRNADAWMVQALKDGAIDKFSGTVKCSDILNQPQYWQE